MTAIAPLPNKGEGRRLGLKEKPVNPLELCFSLWFQGFCFAAVNISMALAALFVLFALCVALSVAFGMDVGSNEDGFVLFMLLAVTFAAGFFSLAPIGLVAVLRYSFIHFSVIGPTGVVGALVIYTILYSKFMKQKPGIKAAIIAVLAILMIQAGFVSWMLSPYVNSVKKSKESRSRRNPLAWAVAVITWLRIRLHNWLSGQWVAGLYKEVEKVYLSNKEWEIAAAKDPSKTTDIFPADIGGDFKAWNDATRLLIAIAAGLAVVFNAWGGSGERPGLADVFKISWVLFLLVPTLSCVYMDIFKRRCERAWKAIEASANNHRNTYG